MKQDIADLLNIEVAELNVVWYAIYIHFFPFDTSIDSIIPEDSDYAMLYRSKKYSVISNQQDTSLYTNPLGSIQSPSLPNITGNVSIHPINNVNNNYDFTVKPEGAFYDMGEDTRIKKTGYDGDGGKYYKKTGFDASRSNSTYAATATRNPSSVLPQSYTINYIISF
jgi:hypothetical protein